MAVIIALALVVVALLIWPRNAPAEPAPAAHIAPAPAAPAKTAAAPAIVRVTGQTGAVCILPGGKPVGPVELVKVP